MRAVAVLVTCIARTLDASDPSFSQRLGKQLDQAYAERRDGEPAAHQAELEVYAWTRTLLTGFSFEKGQGKPFLSE